MTETARNYNPEKLAHVRQWLKKGEGKRIIFYHDTGEVDANGERWEQVTFTADETRAFATDELGFRVEA